MQGLVTKYTNKLYSNEFILFTGVWSNDRCDLSVNGFSLFQLNRVDKKRTAKRDSGGISLYVKNEYRKHCELLKTDSDDIIWLKLDRTLLYLSYDLYLCLCYIIPVGSSREALTEISVLDRISEYIVKIANDTDNCYNIMICGDLNSRVGTEPDFVILDNSRNDVLPEDYLPDDFLPRQSEDKIVNLNGRKLLDFCRQNELRICNGRLGDDRNIGKFTFRASSGRSVVDYVITNITMFEAIQSFKICDPNILSDHCVLEFSILKNENIYTAQAGETGFSEGLNKKYAWDDMKKDHYIFNLNKVEGDVLTLTQNLIQVQESDDIDKNINNFLKVMENVCDPIFAKNIKVSIERPENFNSTDRKNQPWFDEECQTLRNRFYRE